LRGDLGGKVGTVRSDCAGYINGEMVLQNGGAHLRVPAPRICCNGPTRGGQSSAPRGRKTKG
jgi:hypothetical protein